jgi:protein phosphatase
MPTHDPDKRNEPDSDEVSTVIMPPLAVPNIPPVRITIAGRTHGGKVRANNEDHYLILRMTKLLELLDTSLPTTDRIHLPDPYGYVLVVADGMGGHAGGEHASALVASNTVKYLQKTAKWFFQLDDPDANVRVRLMQEELERVDRQLIQEGEHDPALAGMGTTLTAASILDTDVFMVHVGDSPAYLLHGGKLEKLTTDHTLAQELVDQGLLRLQEAKTHRSRHMLTNVLGGVPGVVGQIVKLKLHDGDRLLLCTDGLTEAVRDEQIAEILGQHPDPKEACLKLEEAALNGGGPDNVTAIVAACSIEEVSK